VAAHAHASQGAAEPRRPDQGEKRESMPRLQLRIVTAERELSNDAADMVIAPGGAGELGILPRHLPIITTLKPGELRVRDGGVEHVYVVTGGFMEVRHAEVDGTASSQVIVLANAAERVEDIDIGRAEAARRRAEERLSSRANDIDVVRAEASLLRATARLRVAEQHRARRLGQQTRE
jgi:F-type H+-transporting ATPase subunit epsilon